jgi:hypothetical protein
VSTWLLFVCAAALVIMVISPLAADFPLWKTMLLIEDGALKDVCSCGCLVFWAILFMRLFHTPAATRVARVSQSGTGPSAIRNVEASDVGAGKCRLAHLLNWRRHLQWRRLYLCWLCDGMQHAMEWLCTSVLNVGALMPASANYGLWDFHEAVHSAGFLLPKEVAACRTEPDVSEHVVRILRERSRQGDAKLLPPVQEE